MLTNAVDSVRLMLMGQLWPAESAAKRYYEREGWFVEPHGVLDFLLYRNNVRQAVEVKQIGNDTLSPEQVAAAEMLAILGIESVVCIVEDGRVTYDVPIHGLKTYIECIAKSEPRRAKELGTLLRIPRWTFEPNKQTRERKRKVVEQSLIRRGLQRRPELRSPFLIAGNMPQARLSPQQVLGVRGPILWR